MTIEQMTVMEPSTANSNLHALEHAESLRLLFQQSFPAIFVSMVTAAVLMAILWPVQDHETLLVWFAVLGLSALIRLVLFVRYWQAAPQKEDILAWERPYFLTLMLTTLTWGIGSVLIMPRDSVVHEVVVLSFMMGMSGGALSLYAAHRLMTLSAIFTVLMPITVWLLFKGDLLSLELALAALVFFISAVRATRMISNSHLHSFMLSRELQQSSDRYRHLVEDIGERFVIYSHKAQTGELFYVTGEFASIFGLSGDEALNKPWQTLIDWMPGCVDEANRLISLLIEGELAFGQVDMGFIHPDGGERAIRASVHAVKDETGAVVAIGGIAEDITDQKVTEEKLRLAATVFDHSQDGILIAAADRRIVDANPACCEISGYSREEILGNNPRMFKSGTHSDEFYEEMWEGLNQIGHWRGEIWNRRKDGEIYAQRISIDAVPDEKGKVKHYVAVFHDISYLKQHEAELQRMAYYDILTGLPNRLLLQDRMQLALSQCERNQTGLAVCYLDLDGFKPINDGFGHHAGDQVLVEVATRLERAVRAGDTVTRVGGDEFVVLLVDFHNDAKLIDILDRMLTTVAEPLDSPFGVLAVSASIGVACAPRDARDPAELLDRADHAMYLAKSLGRNQYQLYGLA